MLLVLDHRLLLKRGVFMEAFGDCDGAYTMTDNDREQDTRLERLYIISSFEAK